MSDNTSHLTPHVIRILGIDPGLRATGFGILEKSGGKLTYITSGCIKTATGELPLRLKTILDGLAQVIADNVPTQVAVEKVFVNINPQSTLLLGQARGAAICAAVIRHLPVSEYTALQVKQAVVGNGHAKKNRCKRWSSDYYAWQVTPVPMRQMRWRARFVMRTAGRAWACWRRRAIA